MLQTLIRFISLENLFHEQKYYFQFTIVIDSIKYCTIRLRKVAEVFSINWLICLSPKSLKHCATLSLRIIRFYTMMYRTTSRSGVLGGLGGFGGCFQLKAVEEDYKVLSLNSFFKLTIFYAGNIIRTITYVGRRSLPCILRTLGPNH